MIRTEDIHSLTDFRNHSAAHLDRLAENGGVEVLTVNGQARAVVMAPATFDYMQKKIAWIEHLEKLDEGYADALAGRGKPVKQAFEDIRERIKTELKL